MALKARKIKTTKGRNWKPHHLALPGLTQQPHWHPPAVGGKAGGTGARCVAGTAGLKTTTLRGVAKNEITQSPQHGQDLLQTPKGRYPTTNLAPPPPRSPRSLSTADSARAPLSTADSAFHPPPLSTADSARGGGGQHRGQRLEPRWAFCGQAMREVFRALGALRGRIQLFIS